MDMKDLRTKFMDSFLLFPGKAISAAMFDFVRSPIDNRTLITDANTSRIASAAVVIIAANDHWRQVSFAHIARRSGCRYTSPRHALVTLAAGREEWCGSWLVAVMFDPLFVYILTNCMIILALGVARASSHNAYRVSCPMMIMS